MLKKIFGKTTPKEKNTKETKSNINWIPLISLDQLAVIEKESKESLVAIFKHSTRCSISSTTLQRFGKEFPENIVVKMYYLDLLNYRDISQEVGYKFQVFHQSPQLIVLKDGNVIEHASHYDIINVDFHQFKK